MKGPLHRLALGVCAGAVSGLIGGPLGAARFLEAPTRMAMDGLNQVMLMEVVERLDEDRLRCRNLRDIWGEPSSAEVDIRFMGAATDAQPGERYVVTYTRFRRNRLVRDLRELDPEGAHVVEVPVVGAAVFADRPEVRLLFGERQDTATKGEHLAAAMSLVRSSDERDRRLGIAEVGLGRDLRVLVGPEEAKALAAVLTDATAPDVERELILTAAAHFPEAARGPWLTEAARGILREDDDSNLALATYRPALIERALETLPPSGDEPTLELFVRWLPSNSPGVVKAAIGGLDRLDPELAWEEAMRVLETLETDSAAHRVLLEYTRTMAQPWNESDDESPDGPP